MIYTICDFKNVFFLSELERNVFGIDLRGDENISANFCVIIVKVNYSFFFFLCNYSFTAQREKLINTVTFSWKRTYHKQKILQLHQQRMQLFSDLYVFQQQTNIIDFISGFDPRRISFINRTDSSQMLGCTYILKTERGRERRRGYTQSNPFNPARTCPACGEPL